MAEGSAQFMESAGAGGQQSAVSDKLKNELRLSLDFYYRKFPSKKIKSLCLISDRQNASDLESFIRELGLEPKFLDVSKYLSKQAVFSLDLIKGYACSLYKTIKSGIKLKLLDQKIRVTPSFAQARERAFRAEEAFSFLKDLKISPKAIIIGAVICLATFAYGIYRKLPVQKEIADVIRARPKVLTEIPATVDYKELQNIDSDFKNKITVMDNLVRGQLYATEPLNTIPKVIPAGVWLTRFNFKKDKDKSELTLEGNAFLGDSKREFEIVDAFLSKLKGDPTLTKYFRDMEISSLRSIKAGQDMMTNFVITCKSYIATKKR